jgi:hypothetical protein
MNPTFKYSELKRDDIDKIREVFSNRPEISEECENETIQRRWEERESERQFLNEQNH